MKKEKVQSNLNNQESMLLSGSSSATSGDTKGHIEFLDKMVYGLIVVLFIGFAGMFVAVAVMFIDSFNYKQSTYQNLVNQITIQNSKIEILTNFIKDGKQK